MENSGKKYQIDTEENKMFLGELQKNLLNFGKGIEQKNLSLAKMMIEGNEPIDKIAKYTGYGIDRIKEIAEQMKTPVSV